ncbi:MAG: GNAT family N-acetyltransferase [Neisseriaceae bacterium]|nr:GNAT family N-acetyltransferase [Neisseriaceae bacterium]
MMVLNQLRQARQEDFQDIHFVHQCAIRFACCGFYNDNVLKAWLANTSVDSYLKSMHTRELWVTEYQGKIQGFFQLNLQDGELDALYVHPMYHSKGLGTAMLHRAEKLTFDNELSTLKLYASLNSISFYRLNGYNKLRSCELRLNSQVSVRGELMCRNLYADDFMD